MKISLCMPVFGRVEMLANCLDSILRQTHQDYEVVLKDGNLNAPVIREAMLWGRFNRLGARLKYVLGKDEGIFPALNEALQICSGEVMHFICSDDELGPSDTLETVDKVFSKFLPYEPHWMYGITGGMDERGVRNDHLGGASCTLEELIEKNRIGQPSIFWNRHIWYRTRAGSDGEGFRYTRAADYDMWIRFYRISRPTFVNQVLGIGRRWSQSASHIDSEIVEREATEISKRHKKELGL